MKTKVLKIVSMLVSMMILASLVTVAFASKLNWNADPTVAPEGMQGMANKILGFVTFIGMAIAIGMLIYIGIKYVTSSANEKADLKKGAVNYVIGAILIVAAVGVFNLIVNFADGLNTESGEGSQTEQGSPTK